MNDIRSEMSARESAAALRHPKERRHRRFAWIGTAASVLIFSASLVVLWHIVSDVDVGRAQDAHSRPRARGRSDLAVLLTRAQLCAPDLLRRPRPPAAQDQGSVPHDGARLLHELCGELHPRLSAPHRRNRALLDLCAPGPVDRRGGEPDGRSAGITFWLGMALVLAWSLMSEAGPLSRARLHQHRRSIS